MSASSVLLPEPERPVMATASPACDPHRDAAQRAHAPEALADPLHDHLGAGAGVRRDARCGAHFLT